jgi:hypothetical protein
LHEAIERLRVISESYFKPSTALSSLIIALLAGV